MELLQIQLVPQRESLTLHFFMIFAQNNGLELKQSVLLSTWYTPEFSVILNCIDWVVHWEKTPNQTKKISQQLKLSSVTSLERTDSPFIQMRKSSEHGILISTKASCMKYSCPCKRNSLCTLWIIVDPLQSLSTFSSRILGIANSDGFKLERDIPCVHVLALRSLQTLKV